MKNYSVKELFKYTHIKKNKIVSKDEFKLYFDKINSNGLITIFSSDAIETGGLFLWNLVFDILYNDNRILYLSTFKNKEEIVKIISLIEVKNRENLKNYQLFFNDSIYALNFNIKDLEELLIEFNNKKHSKNANNVVFIDCIPGDLNINFKEIKYLSKKYNVIIVLLCDFSIEIKTEIQTKYDSNEINWQFYFTLINDKYIESTHSDTTFVLQKREFDSGDIAGLYDLYLIQYDGVFGNLEYERPITYNVSTGYYEFDICDDNIGTN